MFGGVGILVTFVLFFTLFCDGTSSECTQTSPCSCTLPNGQGYTLTELSKLRPLNASTANYTFHFHPCTNTPLMNNNSECYNGTGVSLCAEHGNKTFSLGKVEETKFGVDPNGLKEPMLMLSHGKYKTTIGLICCNVCNRSILVTDSIVNDLEYHLILTSPHACKVSMHMNGLSIGSILVILLFVSAGVYFIGGAIVLKRLSGATGWEMLPNHKFWTELPSYVRDGIAFTFNGCQVDSYQQI